MVAQLNDLHGHIKEATHAIERHENYRGANNILR